MIDSPWVRLANNWLHDIGTGLWAACLLLLVVLRGRYAALAALDPAAFDAVASVTSLVFRLLAGALAGITLTGAVRLFYWRAQTPPEQMRAKRPALIWKHAAFLALYVPGTWWAWTLVWRAV